MTESTSADGRKTPAIGEWVSDFDCGANSGVASIWVRKSGLAETRNQAFASGSGENAICVCVREGPRKLPSRKRLQFAHVQFHCGKPPPAADPRILMRMIVVRAEIHPGPKMSRETGRRPLQKAVAIRTC